VWLKLQLHCVFVRSDAKREPLFICVVEYDVRGPETLRLESRSEIGAGHIEYGSRRNAALDVKPQSDLRVESDAPCRGPSVRRGTSHVHFIKLHPGLLADSLRHINSSGLRHQYSGLVFCRNICSKVRAAKVWRTVFRAVWRALYDSAQFSLRTPYAVVRDCIVVETYDLIFGVLTGQLSPILSSSSPSTPSHGRIKRRRAAQGKGADARLVRRGRREAGGGWRLSGVEGWGVERGTL
jgi:hypothetical protein